MRNVFVNLSVLMETDHWIMFYDGRREHIIEKSRIGNLGEFETQPGRKVKVNLPDHLAAARGMV